MKPFLKVMKALADPTRAKMVKLLEQRKMCVCEIQEALGIAQSTTSKHLKTLEDAGLVTYQKDGLWVNYTLAARPENPYAAAMLDKMAAWLDDDPDVAALRKKLPAIDRERICRR